MEINSEIARKIPADKSVKSSLLCFLPAKRRNWLSLFVTMMLAIFRLMSHTLHFFEASILSRRRQISH